jgi:hypothetical protein
MPRSTLPTLFAALLLCGAARAQAPDDRDARALAERIDQHLAARWLKMDVVPAPPADDATFVRRAYLDLTGRIPDILQVRDFLDNPSPNKRAALVRKLLDSPRYADHMANIYGQLIAPPVDDPMRQRAFGVEQSLRGQFAANTPWDKMVRQMILANPQQGQQGSFFYQANEFKPENLASATSRLFLGFKLECAQCHDHPHDKWKRKEFWEFAAFYSGVNPQGGRRPQQPGQVQGQPNDQSIVIEIPGTGKRVQARFPDGSEPKMGPNVGARAVLAAWVTSKDNPYFAKAMVNRLWEYYFGVGLIDPIEELSAENQPSHPDLLDELGHAFAEHNFDVKFLIRTFLMTQAYQRGSRMTHKSQEDPRLFARFMVRGMSPEQLFDSLAQAVRFDPETGADADPFSRFQQGRPMTPARVEFLQRFPPTRDRRTEMQTSILQALYLMNGKIVADATSLESNRQLRYIAEGVNVKTSRKVEQLYLIALSRKPRPDELERLVAYVDKGGPSGDQRKALADIFWALLNSSEFALNH